MKPSMMRTLSGELRGALRLIGSHWRQSFPLLTAALRGTYYAVLFRLCRRDVIISLPFLAYERVSISGPGTVRIGRFTSVYANVFKGLSIATLSPTATVEIGERCDIGGLTIRCRQGVKIGARTMTAYSLVQDVLVCDEEWGKRVWGGLRSQPIAVAENGWLGGFTCLLSGSSIGRDSVFSLGAVALETSVPPSSLAAGNPVLRTVPVARLLALVDKS